MRECNKASKCPWGCWARENTCAICDEGECKLEVEEYECMEIKMQTREEK